MKRLLTTTTLALSVMLVASFQNAVSAQPRVGVSISYQTFYDELDPYGRWMDYPDYGYVWIPEVGADFRPYATNGHWVWSDDYEWMWVSDYDWGWAPFHYGRWMQDPFYGWIWVPGYEWSPAWVAWRDGGDYYGWAPLRPGINISIGFNLGGYDCPVDYWSFAPRRYIASPRIYDYCMPRRNNVTIINQTTIINNYNYSRNVFRTGPRRGDAERYAGRINPVRFRDADRPGRANFRNNTVSVYRPNVQRDNTRDFTPRRVQRFDRNNDNDRNIGFRRNGNNLPERRDATSSRRFDRNDNQPGGTNGVIGNREFNNDRRFERRNTDMPDNSREMRERRRNIYNRNNENGQVQQPGRRIERQENPDRRLDNNNNNNERLRNRRDMPDRNSRIENRPAERRNYERQPGESNRPDGFRERGNSSREMGAQRQERQFQERQSQPRQMEPRQPQQPRREQPRQFERRDNGNGGSGGDNGKGRGRRER